MKRIAIAFFFAFLAVAALADQIAQRGADTVRLHNSPCVSAKVVPLILLKSGDPKQFMAAEAHLDGHDYEACWVRLGDGSAGMIYDDGDLGTVPASDLKEVPMA